MTIYPTQLLTRPTAGLVALATQIAPFLIVVMGLLLEKGKKPAKEINGGVNYSGKGARSPLPILRPVGPASPAALPVGQLRGQERLGRVAGLSADLTAGRDPDAPGR